MSIQKNCYPQAPQAQQSKAHPTRRVRTHYSRKLPQRWTGGPGFRKKRNPAEEVRVMECKELAKPGRWRTRQLQEANRRSSVDRNQNQRWREKQESGWQSAAGSGSEWKPD